MFIGRPKGIFPSGAVLVKASGPARRRRRSPFVVGSGWSEGSRALAPRFLGIRAILAKSFARIHLANRVNFGIVPLVFRDGREYEKIAQGDRLVLETADVTVATDFDLWNETSGRAISVLCSLSDEELAIVRAGGRLRGIGTSA